MIEKIALTPQIVPQKVAFKGSEVFVGDVVDNKEKGISTGSALLYGSLIGLSGLGIGLLIKKPKVVKEVVNAAKNETKKAVGDAAEKVDDILPKPVKKKRRIKNTSPNKNPKPVNNAREAEIIQNIDTKHTNDKARKLVERAERDAIVTPEQQAKYDREIAHRAPTAEQANDLAKLERKNKLERAEKNAIGNQVSNKNGLEMAKIRGQMDEICTKILKDGGHIHPNKNIYFTKDGKISQIRLVDGTVITDEVKIAKHVSKHNITLESLLPKRVQEQIALAQAV